MKRKSGRKSQRKDGSSSNGVEEDPKEQNGDTSDIEDDQPTEKKRRSAKTSSRNASKRVEISESGNSDAGTSDEDDEPIKPKGSKEKKGGKKGRKSAAKEVQEDNADEDEDNETQYEVQAVLDEKKIGGIRHYLIRWKGYEEESDTWEPEDTLDCKELIQEYKDKKKKNKGKKTHKKEKKEVKEPDWDENEDFEVDRILEVHHRKDGKREFLVSWKGYGHAENSWEPEENMDCKDLIVKFMSKVDKAREVDERELRINRKQVQRYTLSTQENSRRLSRRFRGRERVQYHDAE